MPTYARIDSGTVVELFTPSAEFAATPIAELFPASLQWVDVTALDPQPQQHWTYDRHNFAPPAPPPPPTLPQQAEALLAGPVTMQCTSLPVLNGTYPIDATTQGQITGIAAAISAGLGLPGGADTFNWPDTSGAAHQWPAPQFTAFAKAVMNFVYACAQVEQGHTTTLPSSTIAIA